MRDILYYLFIFSHYGSFGMVIVHIKEGGINIMNSHEYRCRKCDYLFDDLMSPVVDIIQCPICGGETIWVMDGKDNGVSGKTSNKHSKHNLELDRFPSFFEESLGN